MNHVSTGSTGMKTFQGLFSNYLISVSVQRSTLPILDWHNSSTDGGVPSDRPLERIPLRITFYRRTYQKRWAIFLVRVHSGVVLHLLETDRRAFSRTVFRGVIRKVWFKGIGFYINLIEITQNIYMATLLCRAINLIKSRRAKLKVCGIFLLLRGYRCKMLL